MKRKTAIKWIALGTFGPLAAYLLYQAVWLAVIYDYVSTPARRRELVLPQITNGVTQITFKVDGEWDVSFRSQMAYSKARASHVQCRLRNIGSNPVLLMQGEENMHLENYGNVKPNAEIIFYEGELGPMLEGTLTRVSRREKSSQVTIEVLFPKELRFENPIIVKLEEYKVML